jgi:hypothetical protein
MYDEFGAGLSAGMAIGGLVVIILFLVMNAVFGHTNVDTMEDIQAPTMYKVTVDGIETMCTSEPGIRHGYLELVGCTGMPDGVMRIKRYLALEFVEVRGE